MTACDTVIRGGTVVGASGSGVADVGVRGERIAAVGPDLGPAARDLDASGLLVLPGVIDVHTHLRLPSPDGAAPLPRRHDRGRRRWHDDGPLLQQPRHRHQRCRRRVTARRHA